MVFMPPALRFERYPNFLYDPAQRADIPAKYAPEEHTPEAAVQRVAAGGGRCVKVHYEPGFGPFAGKLPVPTRALLRSAREASHKRGLPLLLHANSIAAHRFAVDVQPDAVVHGMWNWGANDDAPALPADVVQVLDAEREHGIGMMPTSRVIGGLADLFRSDFLEDPQVARVLPHQLVSWYRSREGQWFARETAEGFRGAPAERARNILREVQARGQRAAVHFANGGGRILFGSDTPSAPTYANPPGYNGYLELRELESSGISPRQLLAASTIENARLFHLEKDYGTVEPGKIASLLLLNADPLRSTAAFDAIDTVVVRGRVISRSTLSAR
jgi:imidazolonepropionase-like amidohydrolase